MLITLNPRIEALLQAEVTAGRFASIEDAITAAVLGSPVADDKLGDLGWAKPLLDEADQAIVENRTFSDDETFAEPEQRFGNL